MLVVVKEKHGDGEYRRSHQFPAHVAGDGEGVEDFFDYHGEVNDG